MRPSAVSICLIVITAACSPKEEPLFEVRGWNILSDHFENGCEVINASPFYEINHLELSHHLIMDLRHVRTDWRRETTERLIDSAHHAGIRDVFVWDRAFYPLDYYPEKFLIDTDKGPRLNLDDQEFWQWFRKDYREMFALLPNVDGIVFTFIETGSRIQEQYSATLSDYEKMAMVVDTA